ncbi:TRAP C4-dicarboxylate transport system permease DctM subunit [Thermanaerovibrio acidaminovorans DSM 6589]|uniref:TRAP C4-dicarboxylate transport system permease DctM subunit n=1 Tax=Thermanaerovibrio acidaminovorans (strain ATCC 49978 / DSM 6589 / Su883) TaxID=525903 RepID=D1B7X2_THEAS|nr:TRAP transporter large permease subunit [Thermanaerovibrio acidaminovorans]ACZ18375.1 TRAP C4-dicarboxylate transport system permease DctM subunit [Thermanaerovibrio acidaminovorans DSM 6589]
MGNWFWPEGALTVLMVGAFILGAFKLKLPISLALGLASVVGAVASGAGLPVRHLVEGMFGYLDTILIIAFAMIFMKSVQGCGLLNSLAAWVIRRFARRPVLLCLSITLLVMLPGMITGSSTAGCLTTGALVAPVLVRLGVPRAKVAAAIAMGAIYGMIAPPIDIPVMIIGGGIDMPYVGFGLPLLLATVPLAILSSLWLLLPHLKRVTLGGQMEEELRRMEEVPLKGSLFLPFLVLLVLMGAERLFKSPLLSLGMPLQFLLAAASAFAVGKPMRPLEVAREAIRDALPVLGILMGVGMFIQVMTLTGVRGFVVVSCLAVPAALLYPVMGISIPLFGAVSAFGAASVLGVPFVLALLGKDQIVVAGALALLSGLGDLMPPTALAGIFAAQVTDEEDYFKVLRHCVVPGVVTALWGLGMIALANPIASLLR